MNVSRSEGLQVQYALVLLHKVVESVALFCGFRVQLRAQGPQRLDVVLLAGGTVKEVEGDVAQIHGDPVARRLTTLEVRRPIDPLKTKIKSYPLMWFSSILYSSSSTKKIPIFERFRTYRIHLLLEELLGELCDGGAVL